MNDKWNPGDRVICVINPAIQGVVINRECRDGVYLYSIKVDDEESFVKHFGLGSYNVIFLHWQLRRV